MSAIIAIVAAYLLGSFPTGYLAGRLFGVDVRTRGSGSTGATNVGRSLGKKVAAAVMLVDVAKGAAAVLLAMALEVSPSIVATAGLVAMIAHAFPVWTGFRGGKAVATGLGASLALMLPAALGLIVIWLAVLLVSRYVSLASIGAALSLPVIALLLDRPGAEVAFAIGAAVLVAALHHANIARLIAGEESRMRPLIGGRSG